MNTCTCDTNIDSCYVHGMNAHTIHDTPANTVEYVAIETKRFTDGHAHYGECAKVMVNGEWRFSTYIMQPYDTMLPVVMLTRIHEGKWQAASINLNTWSVDENITELAQLLPPF